MVLVVVSKDNLSYTHQEINLDKSTIPDFYNKNMTFCYYLETDSNTVFTGFKTLTNDLFIFTKLISGEPVDLTINEWIEQWKQFSEMIPDDI